MSPVVDIRIEERSQLYEVKGVVRVLFKAHSGSIIYYHHSIIFFVYSFIISSRFYLPYFILKFFWTEPHTFVLLYFKFMANPDKDGFTLVKGGRQSKKRKADGSPLLHSIPGTNSASLLTLQSVQALHYL